MSQVFQFVGEGDSCKMCAKKYRVVVGHTLDGSSQLKEKGETIMDESGICALFQVENRKGPTTEEWLGIPPDHGDRQKPKKEKPIMKIDFMAGVKKQVSKEEKKDLQKPIQEPIPAPGVAISQALVITVPASIDPFKDRIRPFEVNLDELVKKAEEFKVESDEDMKESINKVSALKRLWDDVEGERLEVVKKPKKFFSAIDSYCKGIKGRMEKGIRSLTGEQGKYRAAQRQKEREEEEKQRKEREALQETLNKEAKEKGIEPAQVPEVVSQEPEKVVRSDSGASLSFRKEWKHEIEKADKVPRAYCSPDEKKIKVAVSAGIHKIEGVRIFEKETPINRK